MFPDINGSEFVILLLVALILVGPQRLPNLARQAARWLKTARQMFHEVSARVKQEVGDDPLVQELGSLGIRRPTTGGAAGLATSLLALDDEPTTPPAATSEKHWDSEAT